MSIKQKKHKLGAISMRGRMAFTIMCVEAFLVKLYPDRDWTIIAEKMWQSTTTWWIEWTSMYCCFIPDVFLQYQEYDSKGIGKYLTEKEFFQLKELYNGITDGIEDDPNDPINYMLSKPFEIATIYENSGIDDGSGSYELIAEAENILTKYGIELPDYRQVVFSSFDQLEGWGDLFDGRFLSIILNK